MFKAGDKVTSNKQVDYGGGFIPAYCVLTLFSDVACVHGCAWASFVEIPGWSFDLNLFEFKLYLPAAPAPAVCKHEYRTGPCHKKPWCHLCGVHKE